MPSAYRWAVREFGELYAPLFIAWLDGLDIDVTVRIYSTQDFASVRAAFVTCFPDVIGAQECGEEEAMFA